VRAGTNDLSSFRPVSNDEGELIEVGYTLATQAKLASPMFAGFFGAEDHHLWTLPIQHVVDAIGFKVFGAGVVQARSISIVAALAILWCVGWLALKWYGLGAALVAEILLVFWRSNLTAGATGLPLLDLSRVARYDVLAVAFGCLALIALTHSRNVAAGVLAGLAALSQFFGAAILPVLLVGGSGLRWRVAGAVAALAPWTAYVAVHGSDLAGQLSVYGQRGDFLRPTFYVENVLGEPSRYADALTGITPLSAVLLIALAPAAVWLVLRAHNALLATYLLSALALLTIADQTKTPLYAILLVPGLCLLLAAAWSALARFRVWWWAATAVLIVLVINDGLGAYAIDRAEAAQVTPYGVVGDQIAGNLSPGGVVLGPERWWWPVRDRPYISLRSLWFQWTSRAGQTSFADLAVPWQPTNIIVNNNVRDDIRAFPTDLQDQFWAFIDRCARLEQTIDDPTYFQIQIYRVTPDCH
jgi:4-amino-4-deoxy-L-arabinose transferase-like glycosyltransferase